MPQSAEIGTQAMPLSQTTLLRSMEASNVAHTISEPDGAMNIVYANKAFSDLTGYDQDEIIGRNCRMLQGPRTEPNMIARIRAAIARSEATEVSLTNYRRDGSTFLNRLYLAPVLDEVTGRPIAFIGIQSDASRLQRQMRFEQEHNNLAALGRYTARINHEIRNALQPIRLIGDVLKDWQHLRPEDIDKSLATLRENLDFALDLTSDLIRMARGPSVKPPSAAVALLAAQAGHFVQGLLPNTVRLVSDVSTIEGTDLSVAIKPRHLLQVLSNFVANAMDAMDRSGDLKMRWTLTTIPLAQAEALQLAPGNYLRIDVEDNGRGMDEATQLEIFEVFFTTKADEGTGLGLAISQSIVRDAGGVITVQSRPGHGSTFSIHLPTSQAV